MTIYLDDQVVELAGSDLQTVLESARRHLQDRGRIVVEVQLNGRSLDPQQLSQQRTTAVEESDVRLFSAEPRQLAQTTLRHILERLEDAAAAQAEAAELLQKDQQAQAMEQISKMVEVWNQTQQAVTQSSVLLHLDLNNLSVDDQSAASVIADLLNSLRNIRDLIRSGDSIGLADALAYEWPHLTERWKRMLEGLILRLDDSSLE